MSRRESKPAKPKHRRLIRIGVVLPASVELIVCTNDDEPSEDSDWQIVSVVRANCEASPRMVEENMHGADFEALAAAAANAEDVE